MCLFTFYKHVWLFILGNTRGCLLSKKHVRLFISWNTCLCLLSVARVIVYFCSTCCLFSITREGNILSLLNLSKFLLLLLFWHGCGCCDGRYRARLSCFHQHFISTFVATGAMPRLAGSPGVDQKFYPFSSWTSFICFYYVIPMLAS